MPLLELVHARPDWMGALGVALTRPPACRSGAAARTRGATDGGAERPRRMSDDLAWLRQAMDEPESNGLRGLGDTAAVAAWEPSRRGDRPAGPAARAPRARRGRVPAARLTAPSAGGARALSSRETMAA